MDNSKLKRVLMIASSIIVLMIGLSLIVTGYCLKVMKIDIHEAWLYVFFILGAVFSFVGICFIYQIFHKKENKLSVKQMTMIGIMSSITVILYYFVKFNLPFFPPWLDIQVSEIPALITAFAYGPQAGCLVIFVRCIIKLPATQTAGVGEVADLILGVVLVLISSLIYHRKKSVKTALIGLSLGVLVSTVMAMLVNWLMLIPAYITIAGFPMESLVGMLDSYIPYTVTESNFMLTYVFVGVLPFNIFRYIIVVALTFLLYKKTHWLLDRITK